MNRVTQIVVLLLLIIGLQGCAGSSGGGQTGLVYQTNWALNGTPGRISGQSQKLSILDNAGLPVSSQVLRTPTAGIESVTFNLADGVYRLQAELWSGSNADGTQTGIYQRTVTLSGGAFVGTVVAAPISNISVSPVTTTVQVGRGAQFDANGLDTAGAATFVAPNSFTWSVLGSIGQVDIGGNFTATSVGSGTVRATYTPLSLNGAAAVTTTTTSTTTSKWTILVYMNAANDLQSFSTLNMNQMERVAQNSDVRFVVQWKQYPAVFSGGLFNGTRRYLVQPDSTSAITSTLIQDMGTAVDMGSAQTLNQFIQWGKANFPANRYALIVWNHGNGWLRSPGDRDSRAVSYDDEKGTSIQIWDLNQAFGSEQFDIVAWDASLMQMFEVAYEIKGNTKYVVGSEESPPGEGYPYDLIFNKFRDTPDDTTLNLSKSFVDGMLLPPAYASRKITQSVLDTSKFAPVASALSTFGSELTTNSSTLSTLILSTRSSAQSYSPNSARYYRDLQDVAKKIEVGTAIPSVLTAITNLKTACANATVWEAHNSNSANSTGIAIDFSPASVFNASDSLGNNRAVDYAKLKLAQDTLWNEFLQISP